MKEKWVVCAKKADFNQIARTFHIDPVVARIMRNRDLTEMEEMELYLNGGRAQLYDPHLMKDTLKAAETLKQKIREQKKIRIIGDYDIDGIMATYILYCGLTRVGADVDTVIPDRIADGYGLNEHLVTNAATDGIDTIITCDNGISAADQIRHGKDLGMTMIVTDHHEVPFVETDGERDYILPPADAVVNPKQEACGYPFKNLCGAAVAWKTIQVLYETMGIPMEEADEFIEQVGFATVGDVMILQGENRILVKLGLEQLNHTTNIGMKALILQNKLTPGSIKAYHIGFRLGPCLNASGRLETARISLALLLCKDPAEASVLAAEVVELNESRKLMTQHAVEEAVRIIEEQEFDRDDVLVVYLPDCHESLAGIVAGRLRERFHRPSLVITKGEEGLKGSGRSVEAYSMYEELCKCRELFSKFGGHPMAAGFSLKEADPERLRKALNEHADLSPEDLCPKVVIDVPMPIDYIHMGLIHELECLEPFGNGNEKPVFADRNLQIRSLKLRGSDQSTVAMILRNDRGNTMEGIFFGGTEKLRLALEEKYGRETAEAVLRGDCRQSPALHFTYYPSINRYNNQEKIQITISGCC